jgi:hypothetical protein
MKSSKRILFVSLASRQKRFKVSSSKRKYLRWQQPNVRVAKSKCSILTRKNPQMHLRIVFLGYFICRLTYLNALIYISNDNAARDGNTLESFFLNQSRSLTCPDTFDCSEFFLWSSPFVCIGNSSANIFSWSCGPFHLEIEYA